MNYKKWEKEVVVETVSNAVHHNKDYSLVNLLLIYKKKIKN